MSQNLPPLDPRRPDILQRQAALLRSLAVGFAARADELAARRDGLVAEIARTLAPDIARAAAPGHALAAYRALGATPPPTGPAARQAATADAEVEVEVARLGAEIDQLRAEAAGLVAAWKLSAQLVERCEQWLRRHARAAA